MSILFGTTIHFVKCIINGRHNCCLPTNLHRSNDHTLILPPSRYFLWGTYRLNDMGCRYLLGGGGGGSFSTTLKLFPKGHFYKWHFYKLLCFWKVRRWIPERSRFALVECGCPYNFLRLVGRTGPSLFLHVAILTVYVFNLRCFSTILLVSRITIRTLAISTIRWNVRIHCNCICIYFLINGIWNDLENTLTNSS